MKDLSIKVKRNWLGKRVIFNCSVECDCVEELRSVEASIITLLGQISVIDYTGEESIEEEEEATDKPVFGFGANVEIEDVETEEEPTDLVGDGEDLVGYDDGREPFDDEEEYYEEEEDDD